MGENARRWAVRDRARRARARAEVMPGGRTNATKVTGAPYRRPEARAGGGPTCKASANDWVARVTVALHDHLRDARREPAAPPWALVLDTERCDTILALDEAGAIPKRRCVVPNPDAAVCRAARTHGAHAVEATSHAILVPDGPVHPLLRAAAAAAPTRAPDPIPGLPDACRGAVGCVWLDYCGGVSSRGGRRRREDVRAVLAPADAPDAWLAPHAVLALTVSERGAPAMYDGDSLDAVVCLVKDAAARGGRRAATVGTCSYGGRGESGASGSRARMHTLVFAVGPESSAKWLEDIAGTLPAPVRTPGMTTTRGWDLVLGRGDEGARGRDVAVQRVAADGFAAAVAVVARRHRRIRPKNKPRVVAVESRLLPATRAVRAAVPDADVAVAVEDDLDRLVAARAAPAAVRVREKFWDLFLEPDGDGDGDGDGEGEWRGAQRRGEDAVASGEVAVTSSALGAFLDYTGRTRAFARRELASCGAWPQLTATLRGFRRGASRRGVLAVVLNASDDAEYWDGLVIDYIVLGIRRAAREVAAEGTGRGAEEKKKEENDDEDDDDDEEAGDRLERTSGPSFVPPSVEILRVASSASGLSPRAAVLADVRFAPDDDPDVDSDSDVDASVRVPIPATVSTRRSWDVARRKTPRGGASAAATLEWTLPALDRLPPTRARSVMIAEPGGLVVTPALINRGATVRAVACDDAHLAEERRRVERAPRGSDSARVVVHASPRDAADALDAETVAVSGDGDEANEPGLDARLPPPPALLLLVPAFDAGPLREEWRALASAWARRAVATDGDGGCVVALMDATRGADAAASAAAAEFAGDGCEVETLRVASHERRRRRYALVTLAVRKARA